MAHVVESEVDSRGRHLNDRRDYGRQWLWQESTGVGSMKSHWRAMGTPHLVRVFPPSAPQVPHWSVSVGIIEIARIPVGADDDHLAFATAETFARQRDPLMQVLSGQGLEFPS